MGPDGLFKPGDPLKTSGRGEFEDPLRLVGRGLAFLEKSGDRIVLAPLGVEGRRAEREVGRLVKLLSEGIGRVEISDRGGNAEVPFAIRFVSTFLKPLGLGRFDVKLSCGEVRALKIEVPG